MELTPDDIARRLACVEFGPQDLEAFKEVQGLVYAAVDELTAGFFQYLGTFPESRRLMGDAARLDTARRLLRAHVRSMVTGPFDAQYVRDRLELARIYAQVGLENRIFIGAIQHLVTGIGRRISDGARAPNVAFEGIAALRRIAFFDLTLITDGLVYDRERTIRQQQEAIGELSTPVLQVRDRLLIVPLIGVVDTHRARQLTENMLGAIRDRRARAVVMDVTGVPIVDSKVANHFAQACEAARLMGAHVILTGISPEIAQALVTIGAELRDVPTLADLQSGIEAAERLIGYQTVLAGREEGA
jgi:rsbT co-antagonist protein RsbR